METPQPTLAVQLLRPLSRLFNHLPGVSPQVKDELAAMEATGERIPAAAAYKFWQTAIQVAGDPDLGLHVARLSDPHDFQAFEWVTQSAANWADSCEAMCRYVRLLNETAEYRVAVCADKAHIILGSSVPLPRELADFRVAIHHIGIQRWFGNTWPELEIWFRHDEPADLRAYRSVFGSHRLVFRAAFDGFVYDASRLSSPLPTADSARHDALRTHIDRLLSDVAPPDTLVPRLSIDIIKTMHEARNSAEESALRLGMSRRTLVRRLRQHGTSYSELLKEARHRTALHYLHNTEQSIEDIAFLLGYSECAPFVRAFKRWSGRSPLEYRRHYLRTRESHARTLEPVAVMR